MPKGTRRPRAEKPATESSEEDQVERELAAAEKDASTPVEGAGEEAAEAGAETTTAVEEEAPEPPAKSTRRRGATLRVAASGNAEDVRESLAEFGRGATPEAEEEESAEEEEPAPEEVSAEDRFAKLISSPKVFVAVRRQLPRNHNTLRVPSRLPDSQYDCPASFENIKQNVFERFGGEVFIFSAHPIKPNGENTILAAIAVRNPDTDTPLIEGVEIGTLAIEPTEETAEIPMAEEDNDPLRRVESAIADQARVAATFSKLKMSRKLMKEMNKEDDEPQVSREPLRPLVDPEVAILKRQLADRDAEQRMEKRQTAFEDRIMGVLETMAAGKKGGDSNALMIAMMQSADTKFTTLMTTLIPLISGAGKKTDDLDMQLARLGKLREALGDGNGKLKSIETRLMEKAMDRLFDEEGGGSAVGGDVADVAKTALKELAPIAKTFVESKVGAPPAAGPTNEEFKRAVVQEAQRISQTAAFREALANDLAKKGMLIKAPAGAPALPAPTPKSPQASAPPSAPKEAPPKGEEETVDGEEVETPPNPQSPDYDRKRAINFVLDTFIREMPTQKKDGFAVGDVLDRLDEELLKGLLDVSDAEGLKKLIGDDADSEKLDAITNAAQSDVKIKNWLSQVILSAQASYRDALDESRKATVAKEVEAESSEAGG